MTNVTPATACTVISTLDVRDVPHPNRHPLIYTTYNALQPGQAFILVVDHDPKPVLFELDFVNKGKFAYTYIEQGPLWRVQMAKTAVAAGPAAVKANTNG